MSLTSSEGYRSSVFCSATSNLSSAPSPSRRVPVSLETKGSRLDTTKELQLLPLISFARCSMNACTLHRAESQPGTGDID